MSLAEKYFSGINFAHLWEKILNTFVKKEVGKGLSANDYTNDEKQKLSNISPYANQTVVEDFFYSDSGTSALSANKGRELNERVLSLESKVDVSLDGLTPEDEVYVLQSGESENDIPNNTVIAIFPDEESEEIDWTNYYNKAEINEIIERADFKKGKSAYEAAVENGFVGTEEEWLASLKGEPFTYDDFTEEQIDDLRFKFENFTDEQLEFLKGEQGDPFEYEDFTDEQLSILKGDKGDKGDPFEYEDFTSEQLENLTPKRGTDYWTTNDISAITGYIDVQIAEVVDGSPELLNTLSELANAIGNDPNFAVTITELIGTKVGKDELNNKQFVTRTEVENMFTKFITDYLSGYKIRVVDGEDNGVDGYITIKRS